MSAAEAMLSGPAPELAAATDVQPSSRGEGAGPDSAQSMASDAQAAAQVTPPPVSSSNELRHLEEARATIARLTEALRAERHAREQERSSAALREEALATKVAQLERGRAAHHRAIRTAEALADDGAILRSRVVTDIGVVYLELGPIPEDAQAVVRIRRQPAREMAAAAVRHFAFMLGDGLSLSPERGEWEVLAAREGPEGSREREDNDCNELGRPAARNEASANGDRDSEDPEDDDCDEPPLPPAAIERSATEEPRRRTRHRNQDPRS